MKKYNLVDLQLHKAELMKDTVTYYLSAIYRYENDCGIYEVEIPHIELPLWDDFNAKNEVSYYYGACNHTINIGFGDLPMRSDKHGNRFYERLIKEKVHDMTLDEIEKKLGYKVRVVSEKGK